MKRNHHLPILVAGQLAVVFLARASDYPVQPVPFTDVQFTSGLLRDRQVVNESVTLPFALEQCETSGRLKNFDLAAEVMRRRATGEPSFQIKPPTKYPFDDTDVYKSIESAAFSLSVKPDPALADQLEKIIARVGAAQEPDGYLYTFRTMHPDSSGQEWVGSKRWEQEYRNSHELYNLGHLYEAACAHHRATGSHSLLDISLKSAELLQKDFGNGENRVSPGHEIIEMGLAKLYRLTGDKRWLDLIKFFLDNRGLNNFRGEYAQNHKPVLEQDKAVGHAVRANYLYSGMADYAALSGDMRYLTALEKIWGNVVETKLHLTGGCGARKEGEAYGIDYELPHRCYNETCAALALMFWNQRMFLLKADAKYMDVFERTLYNGALSGVSLSGDRFFYPNPLEYDGSAKNNHGFAGRARWFGCACCPPNILRTIASLSDYVYAVQAGKLFVNLYASSVGTVPIGGDKVKIGQSTNYPWDGRISLKVFPTKPQNFAVCLRIPGWAEGKPLPSDLYAYENSEPTKWSLKVNGEILALKPQNGYVEISREWKAGDEITLDLPMPVRRVLGNPKIAATRGQVALERGPIVYALEGIDNDGSVFDIALPETAKIEPEFRKDFLGGVTVLNISGAERVTRSGAGQLEVRPASLLAIPYATWNNRGSSPMAVWLPKDPANVRQNPKGDLSSQAAVKVSFARPEKSAALINDGMAPRNATDGFSENFDFWPHKGTMEWVEYRFEKLTAVKSAQIFWFDDTGKGECRLPASWKIIYRDGDGSWKPVKVLNTPVTEKEKPSRLDFESVTTQALRLEIQLPEKFSSGLYEWDLE